MTTLTRGEARLDDEVLAIIKANPGITSVKIHDIRVARSRAARWFGRESVLTALFGPSMASGTLSLFRLETDRFIISQWASRMPGRQHRLRQYWEVPTK